VAHEGDYHNMVALQVQMDFLFDEFNVWFEKLLFYLSKSNLLKPQRLQKPSDLL